MNTKHQVLDKEQATPLCRGILKEYAGLARMVSKMMNVRTLERVPTMETIPLMEKFRTKWLPEIMKAAAKGDETAIVITDISASTPIRADLENILAGTTFSLGPISDYVVQGQFKVHQFAIRWVV